MNSNLFANLLFWIPCIILCLGLLNDIKNRIKHRLRMKRTRKRVLERSDCRQYWEVLTQEETKDTLIRDWAEMKIGR